MCCPSKVQTCLKTVVYIIQNNKLRAQKEFYHNIKFKSNNFITQLHCCFPFFSIFLNLSFFVSFFFLISTLILFYGGRGEGKDFVHWKLVTLNDIYFRKKIWAARLSVNRFCLLSLVCFFCFALFHSRLWSFPQRGFLRVGVSLARVCCATIFVSSVFFQVVKHLTEDCLESAQSCTYCWRPETMSDQTGNEKK